MSQPSIKARIRQILRRSGFDLVHYTPSLHYLARRERLIQFYEIDLVLDVGANRGQFGKEMRGLGYHGKIVSFEPVSSAYDILISVAKNDPSWETHHLALGDEDRISTINVSGNSYSSSLLGMLPSHSGFEPDSAYVSEEAVKVTTLDSFVSAGGVLGHSNYLKIDTQGYEGKVLAGAKNALRLIDTVQVEMSLVPLYEGAAIYSEIHRGLLGLGFRIVSIEPVFADAKSGELLQLDGIYHR